MSKFSRARFSDSINRSKVRLGEIGKSSIAEPIEAVTSITPTMKKYEYPTSVSRLPESFSKMLPYRIVKPSEGVMMRVPNKGKIIFDPMKPSTIHDGPSVAKVEVKIEKAKPGIERTGEGSAPKIIKVNNVSNESLEHANIGDFTKNPKTGEISKMSGGGHGQENIEFLQKNGIELNIEKTYPNGVRVGNVPDHKSKGKRSGTGQAWFPENWVKRDIKEAGEYVANMPEHIDVADGVTIFGEFKGVRVGVIKTNGEIGTIFPDNMLQP